MPKSRKKSHVDGLGRFNAIRPAVNVLYSLLWEKVYADYENAILSTLGSFSFDKTNVEPEHAACNAVMGKYMAELYTGTLDIDEMLPTIQEELRVAGYETAMAEAQAQLDAYLAAEAAD